MKSTILFGLIGLAFLLGVRLVASLVEPPSPVYIQPETPEMKAKRAEKLVLAKQQVAQQKVRDGLVKDAIASLEAKGFTRDEMAAQLLDEAVDQADLDKICRDRASSDY